MSIEFTMLCNGVEKSLADWGIDDIEFEWQNMLTRYVTFICAGLAVDANTIFPYGATVEIWQDRTSIGVDGKRWFYGRVEPWDLVGSGRAEDQHGRLVGIEWYLQNKIYKQNYRLFGGWTVDDKPIYITPPPTPRVILNVLQDPPTGGYKWASTGEQIIDALQWAISQGAPIQIGNIAPWARPASDFQKGIKCDEVIHKMWRVESDFVFYVDDSTMPYPTVHCLKGSRTNLDPTLTESEKDKLVLTPVNINLNAGNWLEKVHIKPRPDWQKAYVQIFYDQTTEINNAQYLSLGEDHWPDPLPNDTESLFRGVDLFFDLSGARISKTYEEEYIATSAFNLTDINQWKKWKPELASPTVTNLVILTATSTPVANTNQPAPALSCLDTDAGGNPVALDPTCVNELTDGMYHDWMPFNGQKVRATAYIQVTEKSGATHIHPYTVEFTAVGVNLAGVLTKYWTSTQNIQAYAEPQPQNLARVMWQAWQALAAEGTITSVEKELSNTISIANCLNFTSLTRPEWANLNCIVQSISGSAKNGVTNVQFGAPLHLTAGQLIDLLRVCRFRFPSVDLNFIFGGQLTGGGGTVHHPRKSHARAAQHGKVGQEQKLVVSASADPASESDPNKQITFTLDPADVTAINTLNGL